MQKSGSKPVAAKTAAKTAVAKEVTAKTAVPVKQETAAVKPAEKLVGEAKQETLVFDNTGAATKVETEKKTEVKKTTAKKTTGKKTTRKSPAKAVEKVEEVYVQYAGQEFLTKEVLGRAKQAYIAEGHRESSIKSIRLYIKPEEHMAYYVINEKIAGGVPV